MSTSDKKLKSKSKTEWNEWVSRISGLTRSALDVYLAIKTRQPIYAAMGVTSIARLIGEWCKKQDPNMDRIIKDLGAYPLNIQRYTRLFIYSVLNQLGVSYEDIGLHGNSNHKIQEYCIGDSTIYFAFSHSFISGVYGVDEEKVFQDLFLKIKSELGDCINLTAVMENWTLYLGLVSSAVDPSAYVSPIPVADFCSAVKKFQNKGLNRASLLCGPPGTGKTTFAAEVAQTLGGRLLVLESGPINKVVSYGVRFEDIIEVVRPTVILLDDLDRVDRLTDLFGQVERLNRADRSWNILVLGSVNDLSKIPEPLRRPGRFDEIVLFSLPDEDLRRKILKVHLLSQGTRLSDSLVDQVVDVSDGMNGAELREIALQIAVKGFDGILPRIEHMKMVKGVDSKKSDEEPEKPKEEVVSI
jgi:hypothetical protein